MTDTDIVARLRQVQGDNADAREAADIIERLRHGPHAKDTARYVLSTDPIALQRYTGRSRTWS